MNDNLYNSELVAVVAQGLYNQYADSTYKPRDQWEKIEFDNFEKNFVHEQKKQEKIDKELSLNYATGTTTLHPCITYDESRIITRFTIPHSQSMKLYDFYLTIYFNDMNINILDLIKNSDIEFKIGGMAASIMFLISNLLLVKLKGKKIIYNDDHISIPLMLFDLFGNKKFDIGQVQYHDIEIIIYFNRMSIDKLQCKYELSYSYIRKLNQTLFKTKQYIIMHVRDSFCTLRDDYKYHLPLGKNCNLLFFKFHNTNSLFTCPVIKQILLSLNNKDPIIYNYDQDIIEIDLYGQIYYGISFCSQMKNRKSIKHLLTSKYDPSNYNEGINFSRIDKVTMEITPTPTSGTSLQYIPIYTNIFVITGGLCMLKFS